MSPRGQLERLLLRHGIDGYSVLEDEAGLTLRLMVGGRQLQLMVPLPDRWSDEFTRTPGGRVRLLSAQERAYEREVARRWAALRVLATGKLMAAKYGISDLEDDYPVAIEVAAAMTSEPANRGPYLRLSKVLAPLIGIATLIPASSIAAITLPAGTVERLVAPLTNARPDVLGANATSQRVALGAQQVVSFSSAHESALDGGGGASSRMVVAAAASRDALSATSSSVAASAAGAPDSPSSVPATGSNVGTSMNASQPVLAASHGPGAGQGGGHGSGGSGQGQSGGQGNGGGHGQGGGHGNGGSGQGQSGGGHGKGGQGQSGGHGNGGGGGQGNGGGQGQGGGQGNPTSGQGQSGGQDNPGNGQGQSGGQGQGAGQGQGNAGNGQGQDGGQGHGNGH